MCPQPSNHGSAKQQDWRSSPSVPLYILCQAGCEQLLIGKQIAVDRSQHYTRQATMLQHAASERLTARLKGYERDRDADPFSDRAFCPGLWTQSNRQSSANHEHQLNGEGRDHDPALARREVPVVSAEAHAPETEAGDRYSGADPARRFAGGYKSETEVDGVSCRSVVSLCNNLLGEGVLLLLTHLSAC